MDISSKLKMDVIASQPKRVIGYGAYFNRVGSTQAMAPHHHRRPAVINKRCHLNNEPLLKSLLDKNVI